MTLKFSPEELRRIRESKGMTQQALGDAYGRPASINAYERGRNTPGLASIGRLAKVLGVPYTALIVDTDQV
ncbi:helix-turn-helix domain-containing protein [Actinacidiphila rubida]|uniref:Helix-turn-helix n=1 Tax=Actinacidiphila rubida TaxID=310780 RepID=A0A1H8L9Y8_9ACTN|nr:helix-turn-helix transcriptional regulator [Actinacidiphila rubida]SEO01616.1 Helix-turn-helix [Actinacidiphila rubida]